ncbi:hypothetical protein JXQ31_06025 [candidate division KSB1 bacterium]|nr:hypothetical protein [candidate division KSB1 bacterium]
MQTTIMFIGHSGIGKSPLENLFKPGVKISAPLRVRDNPRDEKDIFYIPQQARDTMKRLCRENVLAVSRDIEVYPSVIFFPVRGSDQVVINHTKEHPEYIKYEIFAPVYYDLLRLPAVREYYPFLTGGPDHRVLAILLNPTAVGFNEQEFDREDLVKKAEHGIRCRYELMNDKKPAQAEIDRDVNKRIKHMNDELPAWKALLNLTGKYPNLFFLEIKNWEFFEYTYYAEPVEDFKNAKRIAGNEYKRARLISARRKLIDSIKSVYPDLGAEIEKNCFKTEKEI